MIAIIDYGLGNIQSFFNLYKKLNIPVEVANTSRQLESAERLILPGVGSFDWAMHRLNDSGLRDTLDHLVIQKKMPVLGICVGMQMMAKNSEEGSAAGLSWFDAEVKKFNSTSFDAQRPLPHMGWNNVNSKRSSLLFYNMAPETRFYFLHSFFFSANDPEDIVGFSNYGTSFACAVERGNVFGVQFHPEKSHGQGLQLLKNFAKA
jgi:glutamine amidotransferase